MGWLEEDEWSKQRHEYYEVHDGAFASPSSSSMKNRRILESSTAVRPMSIIPMDYSHNHHTQHKIPLPGETVYLHFNEESEINSFEMSLDYHDGVFAIGLVNSNGDGAYGGGDDNTMLATMPLLRIYQYNNMANSGLGIFCVAHVVGKTQLNQVLWNNKMYDNEHHPLLALVHANEDDEFQQIDIKAANQVATGIEMLLSFIENLESKEDVDDDDDNIDGDDDTLQQNTSILDDFWEAYNVIYESDQQRYSIPLEDIIEQQMQFGNRSWRELKAMSWAAISVALNKQHKHYRLHQHNQQKQRLEVLYSRNTLQRLQLARNLLSSSISRPPTTIVTTATTTTAT